jgi:hypothetical protein
MRATVLRDQNVVAFTAVNAYYSANLFGEDVRQILSDPRAREKPCLRCGRSLRQNLDDRYCPDCGLSVWISLNPNDSLEWSKAGWLSTASKGAWILAGSQVLAFLAYASAGVGYLRWVAYSLTEFDDYMDPSMLATTHPTTAPEFDWSAYYAVTSVPVAIGALLVGIYFIANAAGLWLLSADEKRYPDRTRNHRLAARIVSGISALIGLLMISLALPRLQDGWPINLWSSWVVLILCELTFVGAACCAWLILRRVARRAGKGWLAKLCGYLLFLPAIAFAKALPFFAFWIFALLRPLANLLPIVYIPLSIYLFVRFALMLQRAVPEAEKAWASETRKS